MPTVAQHLPENPEREKYEAIYRLQRTGDYVGHYGACNHGRAAGGYIKRDESVLDVGCGHNEFARTIRAQGRQALGVDFACESADLVADILDLPFSDQAFHVVTAFDVLEHLRPEQVDAALTEMRRVSGRFIFTIAFRDSVCRAPGSGETLHPTVWTPEQWTAKLQKYADGVTVDRNLFFGRWKSEITEHTNQQTEIA